MKNIQEKKYSNTFRLVFTSLMIAAALVLNRIVPATAIYHLSLDFIAVFIVAVMFGPVWALLAYGIADTIGCIILPFGPYNPGITVSLMLIGLVYGLIFYRRNLSGKRIIIFSLIAAAAVFLIKLFLTSYFLYLVYSKGETYIAYAVLRLPNCIAIAAANAILLPLTYKLIVENINRLVK